MESESKVAQALRGALSSVVTNLNLKDMGGRVPEYIPMDEEERRFVDLHPDILEANTADKSKQRYSMLKASYDSLSTPAKWVVFAVLLTLCLRVLPVVLFVLVSMLWEARKSGGRLQSLMKLAAIFVFFFILVVTRHKVGI